MLLYFACHYCHAVSLETSWYGFFTCIRGQSVIWFSCTGCSIQTSVWSSADNRMISKSNKATSRRKKHTRTHTHSFSLGTLALSLLSLVIKRRVVISWSSGAATVSPPSAFPFSVSRVRKMIALKRACDPLCHEPAWKRFENHCTATLASGAAHLQLVEAESFLFAPEAPLDVCYWCKIQRALSAVLLVAVWKHTLDGSSSRWITDLSQLKSHSSLQLRGTIKLLKWCWSLSEDLEQKLVKKWKVIVITYRLTIIFVIFCGQLFTGCRSRWSSSPAAWLLCGPCSFNLTTN